MINAQPTWLFDLDGTLVITDEIYQIVWQTILKDYNITLTHDIFKHVIQGNNDRSVLINLLPAQCNLLLSTISSIKDTLFLENLDKIQIIDGAIEFILELKTRGYRIGIVTNCNRPVAEAILKKMQLMDTIDTLVIGNECNQTKPYPYPYLKAIENLGSTAKNTIIFEDSKVGIQSGKNALPKCLIGIETIYENHEIQSLGVDFSVQNYLDIDIPYILNYKNTNMENITTYIKNSIKDHIHHIEILNHKLKGGFISDVIGLKIFLDDDSKTLLDCVLKMENKQPNFLSKMAKELKLYDREYYFYEHLYNYVPIKTPKYYGTIKDSNFENIGILMENLANKGYELNLDLNKCNINTSLRIIERLTQLHSKFWNKDISKYFPELKKHSDPCFMPKWGVFLKEKWQVWKNKWQNILTPENIAQAEYIIENFEKIQHKMSDRNLTLIHGDIKSANIFYEKRGDTYEPYFIDWQYLCEGKGVQDLVFFMIESFDIPTITKYHRIFKDYYYVKLLENGVCNYPVEDYNEDFKNAICHFPFFVAIWFGTVNEDELIDKNFPFFFIQRLFYFMGLYSK